MKQNEEDLKYAIIQMDNALITKSTKMNGTYQKLFYICLASIKPYQTGNEVIIKKKDIYDLMGYKNKADYTSMRYRFKQLMMKSLFEFEEDEENWECGFLITNVRSTRHDIIVQFNNQFMPLLTHLSQNFTRLLNDDVITFNSKFSMMLYQFLMRYNDSVKTLHPITLTTKEMKKLFGLKDDDYCRKNGKFDRVAFEKKTLDVAVKEINEKARCISKLQYEKKYKHRLVSHYEFTYETKDPQGVAHQMKEEDFIKQLRKEQKENEPPAGQMDLENFGVEIEKSKRPKPSNYEWWNENKEKEI